MERFGQDSDGNYPHSDGINVVGWVKGSTCYYPMIQTEEGGGISCRCKGFQWRNKCRHTTSFAQGDYSVDLQFEVTFTNPASGRSVVVLGNKQLNPDEVTIEEVTDKLLRTETFLEKLLGLKVKIDQVL